MLLLFYCCFCFCIALCMRTMQRERYSQIVHKNAPYLPLSSIEYENGYIRPISGSLMESIVPSMTHHKYVVPDVSRYQVAANGSQDGSNSNPFELDNDAHSNTGQKPPVPPPPSSFRYSTSRKKAKLVQISDDESESDDGDEPLTPPPPYNPGVNSINIEKYDDGKDDKDFILPPPYEHNVSNEDSDDGDSLLPPPYDPSVNSANVVKYNNNNNNGDDDDDDDSDDENFLPPPSYNSTNY